MATIYGELDAQWEEVDGLLGATVSFRGSPLVAVVSECDMPTLMREQGYDKESKYTISVRKTLLASIPVHTEDITIDSVVYTVRNVLSDETHYTFTAFLPS